MDVSEKHSENVDMLDEVGSSRAEQTKGASILISIVFGALLGVCLGILSCLITFHILTGQNTFDMLVRPGWQHLHFAAKLFCGCLAGLLYGVIFWLITRKNGSEYLKLTVFLLTMLLAVPVYFAADYMSLGQENAVYSCIADPFLFVSSLLAGYFMSKILNRNRSKDEDVVS